MAQLLEFEGKELARAQGLAVPDGELAATPAEAERAAHRLGPEVVVKAQVPSGRRAAFGGVALVHAHDAREMAARLLGSSILGFPVETLLIERRVRSAKEIYCAITFAPASARPVLLLSAAGGEDVEAHADRVAQVTFSPLLGLRPWHVWEAAGKAGIRSEECKRIMGAVGAICRIFTETKAELVEVNPLMVLPSGEAIAADVRLVTSSRRSSYPHRNSEDIVKDLYGFDFIELDREGEIGLITTGAGASMMLVDMLVDRGVSPINFCDIRTGGFDGDATRFIFALRQLATYPNLRRIAINIFAGVTDLEMVSELVATTLLEELPSTPITARLEGANADVARSRLVDVGIECVESLEELADAVTDRGIRRPPASLG